MTATTRERNMRWILLAFALICFLLAGYLFVKAQDLGQRVTALTAQNRPVEQSALLLQRKLWRTKIMLWASAGGGVLLVISAAATGWRKGTRES